MYNAIYPELKLCSESHISTLECLDIIMLNKMYRPTYDMKTHSEIAVIMSGI